MTLPYEGILILMPPYYPCAGATHRWTRDSADEKSCSGLSCSVDYYEAAATRGTHTARLAIDYRWAHTSIAGCYPGHVESSRTYVVQYPPTVQITSAPDRLRTGQAGTFSATGTLDADYAANDSLAFSWDFGDGGGASGATVVHSWAKCGDHPVTVTASDGGLTTAQTIWIRVTSYNCTVKPQ